MSDAVDASVRRSTRARRDTAVVRATDVWVDARGGRATIEAIKRESRAEEINRRARARLGICNDPDEAWAALGATPGRGWDAAREAWVQCDAPGCARWRRVPRCVGDELGRTGSTFTCADGKDGRFNACARAQEATDREIDAILDESLRADEEAKAASTREVINARTRESQKRKRMAFLEERHKRGEIDLRDDGTYTVLVSKKAKNGGKNGSSASVGVAANAPPHPGPFDEWSWVQCEGVGCGKWRKVKFAVTDVTTMRDRWVCAMNADKEYACCSKPQELENEEVDKFMQDQEIRKIQHQAQLQAHYAHFAAGRGPIPKGLIRVSVPLTDEQDKPTGTEDAPKAPPPQTTTANFEKGPEDPPDWVPGTPRPKPPLTVLGDTIPLQIPVVCNGFPGVYLARRNMFRCHCEQPEHECASASGEGDGRLFTGTGWEAHCGKASTRKYKASVKVLMEGPVPQMFIGRWFERVGLEIADGKGGGKSKKSKTKNVMMELDEAFIPGPINQLSLRNLMTIFGFILDGSAQAEVKSEIKTENDDDVAVEPVKPKKLSPDDAAKEAAREIGRFASVCKSWRQAAETVLKSSGIEKSAKKKNPDTTALRTQFTVIEEYVDRMDDKECQIERSVTLADNHPFANKSKNQTANVDDAHPPGWWPSLGTKSERKKLVTEVIEQETYGVDFVTGRDATETLKRVLPDFSEDDVWKLYKQLLSQVNESYGKMTPDTLATQSLALAAEDLAEKLERKPQDPKSVAFSKALWKLASAARATPEYYLVHRKGFGVVCKKPIKKGEFLIDFLGEIYPPWAWAEKQDAIRSVQKTRGLNDKGPPEFYNMQIERPGGDAEGYSVLFCDAMHENNYAGRLSHTCEPNVDVNLKAINGKYEIHFITNRDIEPGEELAYNYHSCTDNMKEVEAAFCLCGARMCRGSYLNFVGEDNHSQVLEKKHKLIDRQVMMLKAIDKADKALTPKQVRCLSDVGYYTGKGLLRKCPGWLLQFVGEIAVYMNLELNELPKHILEAAKKEHEKLSAKGDGRHEFTYTEKFAKIDALAMRENRTQCVAIMLSKVRRLLTRPRDGKPQKSVYDCLDVFEKAEAPYVQLSEEEIAAQFWGASAENFEKSIVCGLLRAMGPHERKRDAAGFVLWASAVEGVAEKVRAGKMKRKESLLWLRDELKKLPRSKGARHDLAAGLLHLYASTERIWQPSSAPEHSVYKSDKTVLVREDEVTAWGVGAGGGGDKIVARVEKAYKPGFTAAAMLLWHKQETADPTQHIFANRKGNLSMPDIACCYSSRPGNDLARAGEREHETWIQHLKSWPEEPWPQSSGPWGPTNQQRLLGSPILDAWMKGDRAFPKACLVWLTENTGS